MKRIFQLSYFAANRRTVTGPVDNTAASRLLVRLLRTHGSNWLTRGYTIAHCSSGFDITGDSVQFYLDAVANEAQAPLALAFLARFAPDAYESFAQQARDDMIDLDESQEIFLQRKTLEEVLGEG